MQDIATRQIQVKIEKQHEICSKGKFIQENNINEGKLNIVAQAEIK